VNLGDGVLDLLALEGFFNRVILDLPFQADELALQERLGEGGEIALGVDAVLFGAGFILALLVLPTLAGGKVEDDPLPRRVEEICGRGSQLAWGEESHWPRESLEGERASAGRGCSERCTLNANIRYSVHADPLRDGGTLCDFERGGLGDVGAELRGKLGEIAREDLRVLRCARNGDVGKAGIDEFRVNVGVHVDQNALRGESLRTVRGHGVAVIEVPHLGWIEGDHPFFSAVH